MGDFEGINFENFDGREEELKKVKRFMSKGLEVMHYRTNLLMHGKRVHILLEDAMREIYPLFPEFDEEFANVVAEVHDDPEIITGDVPFIVKSRMTKEELKVLEIRTLQAIDQLSSRWPTYVGNINYKTAMMSALYKDCVEAKVVSFFDKIDAMGETLHELQAGNRAFLEPFFLYQRVLRVFGQKYPRLRDFLRSYHPLIAQVIVNPEKLLTASHTATIFDVCASTGDPLYDRWRELTIEHFSHKVLTERVE